MKDSGRFLQLGSRARSAAAIVSPRTQVCSGLLPRPREPDLEDYESADEAKIAWKVCMKESITVAEGLSCVLDRWKANSALLIAPSFAPGVFDRCLRGFRWLWPRLLSCVVLGLLLLLHLPTSLIGLVLPLPRTG